MYVLAWRAIGGMRGASGDGACGSGLDWFERARALRRLYCRASSFRYVLPGVALVVGTRGASTGGAGASPAVVVAFHGDAVAFIHGGLRRLRPGEYRCGNHSEGGGERAGDRGVGDGAF